MIKRVSVLFLLGFLLVSCATQQFTVNDPSLGIERKNRLDNFFIGGIGQDVQTRAADLCNGSENVVRIETQLTFINSAINLLTWGIWTPRQSRVYCKTN